MMSDLTPAQVTAESVIQRAGGVLTWGDEGAVYNADSRYLEWMDGDVICSLDGSQMQMLLDALVQAAHSQALAEFEQIRCPTCLGHGPRCLVCQGTGKLFRKTWEGGK